MRSLLIRACARAPVGVVLLLLHGALAIGDEVHLKSGEVIEGEILREDSTEVVVRVKRGAIRADMTYSRGDIVRVVRTEAIADVYRKRASETGDSAPEQAALAAWCHEKALKAEAISHAKRALALDPRCARARALLEELGLVEVEGQWVDEKEHLARKGLVRYGGEVVTEEKAAREKEVNYAHYELGTAKEKARGAKERLGKVEREIARRSAQLSQYETEQSRLAAACTELEPRIEASRSRIVDLKAKLDAATAQVLWEREAYGRPTQAATFAENAARADWQAEVTQHDRMVATFNTAVGRLRVLAGQIAASRAELAKLAERRLKAQGDLAAAESDVGRAEKRLARARAGGAPTTSAATKSTPTPIAPTGTAFDANRLRASVVLIYAEGKGQGSGFFISERGHLVTNAHVVHDARQSIYALWDESIGRPAERMRVLAQFGGDDLALLVPEAPRPEGYAYLRVAERYDLGTPLMAASFPLAETIADVYKTSSTDIAVSTGVLGSVRREGGVARWLQTDCQAASGSSGGPLIDSTTGAVIGVITSVITPDKVGAAGDELQMAVPARLILERFGAYVAP